MSHPRFEKNRTNGRFAMPLLERVAPGWLEARALKAFATPRRPTSPREPRLGGARRFTLDVRGSSMVAWEWGSGPTALLLHGWSGYGAQMEHLAAPLLGHGFHVVTVDLPAHGQSEGDRLTLPRLADVVGGLLWHLRPQAVIAHSFGAAALTMALHEGVRPQRVALVAPPVEMVSFAHRAVTGAGLSMARAEGMVRLIEKEVGPMSQFDMRRLAERLDVPAVLVHDRRDLEVPFAMAAEVAQAWCGCQLVPTEGYGHLGLLKSVQFSEALANWVAGKSERLQFDRPAGGVAKGLSVVQREAPAASEAAVDLERATP